MKVFLLLNNEDIQKMIPYALICQTMGGSWWDTGKRRRAWTQAFSEDERRKCGELHKKANDWHLRHGAPNEVRMLPETFALWQKLGEFCYSF